jgi:hypothetical protein
MMELEIETAAVFHMMRKALAWRETMALTHIPPAAAQATILDPDGIVHRLEECWATRPAVIVFIRHFG